MTVSVWVLRWRALLVVRLARVSAVRLLLLVVVLVIHRTVIVKSALAPNTRDRDRRQSIRIALLRGILLGWRVARATAIRRIVRHGRL